VGGVDGDRVRSVVGSLTCNDVPSADGVFYRSATAVVHNIASGSSSHDRVTFDLGRVVPVGSANAPRRWGALACVYLGRPTS